MSLILRRDKGSKLSITELDSNFEYLNSKASSTGDITFSGTTMSSNTLDKDIVIETKGEGGVVIQNDKPNSWALNVGLKFNDSNDVWGSSITVDDEGNSYTTGGDYLINDDPKGFVIKTNKIGEIVWQKHIKEYTFGESIVYKNGHLYILLTDQNSNNILIIKLDTDGNSLDQWRFEYPSGMMIGGIYGYEIDVDEDENVYWVGFLYNYYPSGYDIICGKLNTTDNVIEWNSLLDSGDYVNFGYSIKYKNNYVYVAGTTRNGDGTDIMLITKLDTDGVQVWSKTIDNDPQGGSHIESITVDNLDNIYVCGLKNGREDGITNFYLKLSSSGNLLWGKKITNTLSDSNRLQIGGFYSIDFNDNDGFLYISTIFNGDIMIFKIDTNGNIIWQNLVGTNSYEDTYYNNGHRGIKATNDSLYLTGYNHNNIVPGERYGSGSSNMFLLKYDINGLEPSTFQDWTITTSSFTQSDYTSYATSSITLTITPIVQSTTNTNFEIVDVVIPGNTNFGFDSYLTNFSNKKTQLKVKGEINVNDLYVLPESTGKVGEVLTYPESGNTLQWDKPGTSLTVDDFVKSSWMMPTYQTNFGDDSQISTTSSYKQIIGQREVNILTIYNYYLGGDITIKRNTYSNVTFTWEFGAGDLQMSLSTYWNDMMISVDEIYSDEYDKKFRIRSSEYNTDGNSVVTVNYSGGLTASIETIQGYSSGEIFKDEYVEIDFSDYPYYPNSGGTIDDTFDIGSGFNAMVFNIETQSDGKILVAGNFDGYDEIEPKYITRLNIDGTLDTTFESSVGFNDIVKALKIQPDGKVLVGGAFTTYSGTASNHIIRLNSNGSIDKSFNIGDGFNGYVRAIEIQSDGKILVGGDFSYYNGTGANGIIRLNSDGTIDTTFVYGDGFLYNHNGNVFVIKVLSTGNILVGGWFYDYDGISANNLIELDSIGAITNTFSIDGRVSTIVEQPDGKILLGGFFSKQTGGDNIMRLNSDLSWDNLFNNSSGNGFNGYVQVIKLQSDGKILCGGQFTTYYDDNYNYGMIDRTCSHLVRLNSNGTFDTTFDVGEGFNNDGVNAIAIQSDDKILVGGWFTNYNGNSKNRIVRLYSGSGLEAQYIQPEFMGVKYDKVAVSAKSYLTFGGGSSLEYTDSLELPGIFISSSIRKVTNYDRGYGEVYSGLYINSYNETIFKIRYLNTSNSFAWEVCFIIGDGNAIDIKIGESWYYDASDSGLTAIKDTNFIRKEFIPKSYSNYYLPEAWGTRDVKSDSIKLNNPGITYSINENVTEVNLPIADSDWTAPNAYEQEWKVRTYNGSNFISSNGSKYTWFDFSKTLYGGQNLKGGIIEYQLHDSVSSSTVIGTITFNVATSETYINAVGPQYVKLVEGGITYDDFGVYGIVIGANFNGNFWIHWTSRLFYGSY